ncbi:hypothetical protein J3459_007448 [Metarhizium acridum]|nr:hypothetical protein J3459_007448 [Metarhizium acridum]
MRFIAAFASLAGLASVTAVGLNANVEAGLELGSHIDAEADLDVSISAAKKAHEGYQCPHSMSYCPWTKACFLRSWSEARP